MNDFTKEELISILDAFNYVEDDPCWRNVGGIDDPLKSKIQSMIDNYCEHINKCTNHNTLVCEGCGKEW